MEALLRQVKQQLESWPEWKSAHKIVLAISGGVDSMVLLDLMSEMVKLQEYSDKEIIVAHFNHQLRSPEEHIAEQNLVKKQAEAKGFTYFLGKWETPVEVNVEATARDARYQFFADVLKGSEADTLMTGHHLNDTVETYLMRVLRGTSMKGSRGIPANYRRILTDQHRHAVLVNVLRPLIAVPKQELYDYAAEFSVEYLEDATNDSHKFLRNRIRHQLVPFFEKENPQFLNNMLALQEQFQASYLTHFEDYLAIEPQLLMRAEQGYWILYVPTLRDLSANKLKTYLSIFFEERLIEDVPNYNKAMLDQMHQLVLNDSDPNAGVMLGAGWEAVRQYDFIYIRPSGFVMEPKEEQIIRIDQMNQWISLSEDEELGLFEIDFVTTRMKNEADHLLTLSIPDHLTDGFYMRHRQDGDEMAVVRADQTIFHKKISRIMIDQKIPSDQRFAMWLLCDKADRIVWLIPLKYSGLYQPQQTDTITHIFLYRKVRK